MNVSVSTGPSFSYFVTAVEADRAIDAVIADADGGPIALDIESAAAAEEAQADRFDEVVVNDDVDRAVAQVAGILTRSGKTRDERDP